MRPGDTVSVVKGKYKGATAIIKTQDGYFLHVDIVGDNGAKIDSLPVHRSHVNALQSAHGDSGS